MRKRGTRVVVDGRVGRVEEVEIGGEDCVWNGCGGKKKNDCQSQNVLEKKEYKRCVVEKQAC